MYIVPLFMRGDIFPRADKEVGRRFEEDEKTMQHTRRGRKESELEFETSGANALGEAVRTWRRRRGLTVTELAILAGFGPSGRSYVSKVEHGAIRRLGAARLRAIAESLQIRLEDLLPRVAESSVAIDAWAAIDQALSAQPSSTPQSTPQWGGVSHPPPEFSRLSRELLTGELLSANVDPMIDGFLLQLEATCLAQIRRFLQGEVRARLNALIQDVLAHDASTPHDDPPEAQPLPTIHESLEEGSSCSL